jgi:hypothetical protein
MDANESKWFELLRHGRNGLAQEKGARFLLKQHIVAFSQNGDHISRLEKQDSPFYLDSNPGPKPVGEFLQASERLYQARRLLFTYLDETWVRYEIHAKTV